MIATLMVKLKSESIPMRYYVNIDIENWSSRISKGILKFNRKGVVLMNINNRVVYNPALIAHWGLYLITRYVETRNSALIKMIRNIVEWFQKSKEETEYGGYVWRYNFSLPSYHLKQGWISGLAQGLIISFFIRASIILGDSRLLDTARKTFLPMIKPKHEGGVAIIKNAFYWIEECPSVEFDTFILNGFIFSIFGIYDILHATGDRHYLYWFKKALLTLLKMLPLFDLGFWSLYDLAPHAHINFKERLLRLLLKPDKSVKKQSYGKIASIHYHKLHIQLLRKLYNISGIELFNYYAEKWSLYFKIFGKIKHLEQYLRS